MRLQLILWLLETDKHSNVTETHLSFQWNWFWVKVLSSHRCTIFKGNLSVLCWESNNEIDCSVISTHWKKWVNDTLSIKSCFFQLVYKNMTPVFHAKNNNLRVNPFEINVIPARILSDSYNISNALSCNHLVIIPIKFQMQKIQAQCCWFIPLNSYV